MKKLLSKTLVAATVVASVFSTTLPMAYATETQEAVTPTIMLNGEPADVRAKMIDDKLYFSVRDFWANIALIKANEIKWYGDTKTVSDGWNYIQLDDQTLYSPYIGKHMPLTDPAVLLDGTTYVAASFLEDIINCKYVKQTITDTSIHFRNLIWEQDGYDLKYHYRVSPIPINVETGLPDFESLLERNSRYTKFDFRVEDYDITKTETEDGGTIFRYVNKNDPKRTLRVQVQDGYVSHVMDHGAIILYRPR